jgi:hypothetical protein
VESTSRTGVLKLRGYFRLRGTYCSTGWRPGRPERFAAQHPALYVAFDLLAVGGIHPLVTLARPPHPKPRICSPDLTPLQRSLSRR